MLQLALAYQRLDVAAAHEHGVARTHRVDGGAALGAYEGVDLGLGEDLRRAREGRKIRAGKGTMRGRVHKTPKSVLLVVSRKEGLAHAVRNLPGVDVVAVKDLCAEDLAPGGAVGRLTVFTKSAVEAMN